MKISSMLVVAFSTLVAAVPASAQTMMTTTAQTLGPYFTTWQYSGDCDFDGHGPSVDGQVSIFQHYGKLWVMVNAVLTETTGGATKAGITSIAESLAQAPSGQTFHYIWKPSGLNHTWTWVAIYDHDIDDNGYIIDRSKFQYTDTNWDTDYPALQTTWFVDQVSVVGDTRGNDICGSTSDDSQILASYPAIYVLAYPGSFGGYDSND